ncbi:MAG: YicC family protein [Omnitrophica WOR_2 bacterium RBG_13_44_8b]|nr:MAG: YicC family protein [Omnitrophica WOR_2 bacterium RBG_13_44_8b]
MQSMTGFGSCELEVKPFGKISVELRSSNHKFLESVFHLSEGLLALEDKVKKEIESKIKRGRVTCAINIWGVKSSRVIINKPLLRDYLASLNGIKKQFGINEEMSINTLIHLPGVLSLEENSLSRAKIWPKLKAVVDKALHDLVETRKKEGASIQGALKTWAGMLNTNIGAVKTRFKKAIADKLQSKDTDEERSSFLKDSDITEEVQRLSFHIRNFNSKLAKIGPIGKELDFIAQEMQREANTMGAKSFDADVSARVVQIKSTIEKIREQVQNIE